jgi:hypothetical protein
MEALAAFRAGRGLREFCQPRLRLSLRPMLRLRPPPRLPKRAYPNSNHPLVLPLAD